MKSSKFKEERISGEVAYAGKFFKALEPGKPLSFLTQGQTIPEDLDLADPDVLLQRLFSRERAQSTSAA